MAPPDDDGPGDPDGGVHLVLRRGDRTVSLGTVLRGRDRCGLGFVDDLLRLRLALGRFGWALELERVPEEVVELFELVGLCPRCGDQASRNGGRSSWANSSG